LFWLIEYEKLKHHKCLWQLKLTAQLERKIAGKDEKGGELSEKVVLFTGENLSRKKPAFVMNLQV
jgi:hypothetical protein